VAVGLLCASLGGVVFVRLVEIAGDVVEFCRASSLLFGRASHSANPPG
jgi:hypothetical protein